MTLSPEGESAVRQCPACHAAVPAGDFCAHCGVGFGSAEDVAAGTVPKRSFLRPRVFAAAPHQRVEWPLITSSLFPRLTPSFRRPFRHALILLLAMLLGFSVIKALAALVIVTALGVPLLFAVYLWETGAFTNLPRGALATAVAVGVGSSVAWWLWSSDLVARAYGVPLAVGAQLTGALTVGLVITLAGELLMLLPALLVRLMRFRGIDSLDGFLIGAFGALLSSASATITWFAPQFLAGLIDNFGQWRLFEEAYLYGIVDPLTAAAAGGAFGLALWFRPDRSGVPAAKPARAALWLLAALAAATYMAVYVVDARDFHRWVEIGINTVLTAISVLVVRLALQVALLHGEADPPAGQSLACAHCGQLEPGLAFCPHCGVATRASQNRRG